VAWKKRVFSVREKCYRKKRCVLFFSFKWRFEWRMTIGEKFQNQGGDRFARNVVHDIAHLPYRNSSTRGFCSLWLKGTWLDSVFDAESEYIKFRKLQWEEEDEISSFLKVIQILCFFGTLSILRISTRKLDRIRIKRWYSESAQSGLSEYVASNRKLR